MTAKEIIESGMLESYALGGLEGPELALIEKSLSIDEAVRNELSTIEHTLFLYAQANAIEPNPTVKPLLMGKIDYLERLKNGEVPGAVDVLNPGSRVEDFDVWIRRDDMQLHEDFDEGQVNIISIDAEKMTAIVWLKSGAPPETHVDEYENFLILEGTCDVTIGTHVHKLSAGSYLSIPLHETHNVRVTSKVPCKFVLQRVMA